MNLKEKYQKQIIPELKQELSLKNNYQVPKLVKVVINVGLNKSKAEPNALELVGKTLMSITGQKGSPRKAKKAISGFKIRKGDIVGLAVTLRGQKMYDFIERLANVTLPRIRDFRGLDPKGFDPKGNYNLGIKEQIAFAEVQSFLSSEKKQVLHGLEITIVTSAKNPQNGQKLLEKLGFPFKK